MQPERQKGERTYTNLWVGDELAFRSETHLQPVFTYINLYRKYTGRSALN